MAAAWGPFSARRTQHLYYEFLCNNGATFVCAVAPLSTASLAGKVSTRLLQTWIHVEEKPSSGSAPFHLAQSKMQKSVRYNEGHALFLSMVARKEGTKRGYLSKKTTENSRWHDKFFALYQNLLFYFESEQSARPAGIYLLEGCTCERVPAPKMSTTGKEAMDKQVRLTPGIKLALVPILCPN